MNVHALLGELADVLGALLLGALLVRMRREGLYRTYPWFFTYLAAVLAATAIEAPLGYPYSIAPLRYPWYFYVEWTGDLLTAGLGVVVILEVYVGAFSAYAWLHTNAKILYRWAGASLLLLAAFLAWQTRSADGSHLMFVLLIVKRSIRVVETGLLLVLFGVWTWLRLPRRTLGFGVALGYGLYAAVDLVSLAVRTWVGPIGQQILQTAQATDYLIPLGIWAIYVLSPQPAEQAAAVPATKLDEWNQQLGEMLRR